MKKKNLLFLPAKILHLKAKLLSLDEQCKDSEEVNPLSANFTKWSNTLKQFVGKLPTNFLSVFDHFVGFAFKGLR